MAKKKAPKQEKPKLVNTKPKIVLNGAGKGNGVVNAGTQPRQIPSEFFHLPEYEELTKDEKRLVEEYLIDRNQVAAYYRAGMVAKSYESACVNASIMFRNPKVKAAVEKAKELIGDVVMEDAVSIALNFKQIRDRCKQAEPVYDKEGNFTGEYRFEAANAITANKELGLAIGVLRNKVEMTGKDGKAIEMNVKVEGQISFTLSDLGSLSLPARKEVLAMLEAKENGNGTTHG